ncbi:apoptotic chromatin condensation inducer in the nucleus isoform X7 [Phocoena sinus]|uniref:apoptotic chromatin condensation inducer in the nucleus isoform X7 n=1 Tax=Phocoena sinus TaxID=42100 RepID=UPI0013C4A2E9|nr:apoptotic chromatin condensation inducer in the nucleus isoform X7 [Phocoena sinus]
MPEAVGTDPSTSRKMAELEEVTLDGKPLQALRVTDLKAALEQRGLAKSGQKSALVKRLKGALMLENLQKHSTPHAAFQPNSQIGEEMSQNSFIKQYLEKQQELLRQRLEREAREAAELEEASAESEDEMIHPEGVASLLPPDFQSSLERPELELSRHSPRKSASISEEKGESDDEKPRKGERRSSRVRQARAAKLSECSQAAEEEEDQETPSRNLRLRADRNLKTEEEEEEDEEEEEEEEEEEDDDEGQKSRDAPVLKQFKEEEGEEKPSVKVEEVMDERSQTIRSQEQEGLERGGRVTRSQEEARRSHLARHQQEKEMKTASPLEEEEREIKPSKSLEEKSKSPSPPRLTEDLEKAPVVLQPEQTASEEETPPPLLTKEASSPPPNTQLQSEEEIEPMEGPAPPVLIQLSPPNTDAEARELLLSQHTVQLVGGLSPLSSPADTKVESPVEKVPEESVLPLVQKSTQAESSTQKGLETESEKSAQPLPLKIEEFTLAKGITEESLEQKEGRRASHTLVPSHRSKRSADSSSSRSSSSSSSSSRSRSRSPDSSGSQSHSPPRSKQRNISQAGTHSNPRGRPKMGSRSTSESRSRSRSRSRSASSNSRRSLSPGVSRDSSTSYTETKDPSSGQEVATPPLPQLQVLEPKERTSTSTSIRVRRMSQPEPAEKHVTQRLQPERGSPKKCEAEEAEPPAATQPQTSETPTSHLPESERIHHTVEEKEEVTMDTSENRPENEVPEPPMPIADQVSNDDRPEGSAEDEEKKESSLPKSFKRKISVVSATKGVPAGNSDTEGGQPSRKRRWGASTATTQKKPSISITTESLKSLIPDIKPLAGQEAVVDLHADDSRISEDETERNGDDGTHDKGLKICRTVTQVVPSEGQENGQREEEEEEKEPEAEAPVPPQVSVEVALPPPVEHEVKKVTLGDTLTRRSISQQKSGVSITIDDPVRTAQVPSPPRGKISNIVHISNLVRPFTLGQLKELLGRTGTLVEEAFWIDKIKSHCFVTYSTVEEAVATRTALHGVKWPQSNPKFLCADYAEQDERKLRRNHLPSCWTTFSVRPRRLPASIGSH